MSRPSPSVRCAIRVGAGDVLGPFDFGFAVGHRRRDGLGQSGHRRGARGGELSRGRHVAEPVRAFLEEPDLAAPQVQPRPRAVAVRGAAVDGRRLDLGDLADAAEGVSQHLRLQGPLPRRR